MKISHITCFALLTLCLIGCSSGSSGGSGSSDDPVIPTHDLGVALFLDWATDTIVGSEIILKPYIDNNSDSTFTGEVTILLEYNRNDEGYQTLHEETIDITILAYTSQNTEEFSTSSLPVGDYVVRLTITSALDTTSDNNQRVGTGRNIIPAPPTIIAPAGNN